MVPSHSHTLLSESKGFLLIHLPNPTARSFILSSLSSFGGRTRKPGNHLSLQITMEESMSSPAEVNSIAYLNKKRKLQAELQEMPLPKHVCWGHSLESDSLLASSTEPKKVQSNNVVRGGESDTESARDSNSFHCNEDSIMSIDYESKTETECPETSAASYERTSSSVSWADSTSEISLYSSKSTSLTKSCCSEPESLSVTKQLDRPDSEYELDPSLNYDCSEYRNEGIEHCTEKELENLLYSNGVAPGNYVLSSGRWSVNQDTQQEGKKLTIDKEFEQYFAMLML